MNIPVYNCLINENPIDESGIYAISFVDAPANKSDFIALSKQHSEVYLNKDPQKQILTGVVLCPDQLIYRKDQKLGEYYIKFSAEQIEKIAQKMMYTGLALQNTTHQHQTPLKGNYLSELWIIEDPEIDKSHTLGFKNLSKGTLMCSYKIEDKHYWDTQVMTGNVKGFSLEGFFIQKPDIKNKSIKNKFNKMNKKSKKSNTLLSRFIQYFLDIQAIEKADATTSGSVYMIFTLTDGKEVYVDKDGFATLEDEQLPAGEHALADGNILVVDEEGQFIETKETSAKASQPQEATAPEALQKTKSNAASETDSTSALKAKIAELESKLAELTALAQEANTEIQALRKQTPSSLPLSTTGNRHKVVEMKRYEQMAQALSFSIKNKTNK